MWKILLLHCRKISHGGETDSVIRDDVSNLLIMKDIFHLTPVSQITMKRSRFV